MSSETNAHKLKPSFIRFGSFFFGTNTPGQPVRDFWMNGRMILSSQVAMQTGGFANRRLCTVLTCERSVRRPARTKSYYFCSLAQVSTKEMVRLNTSDPGCESTESRQK